MKKVKLQKIHIRSLIELLEELSSHGAIYIDIIGVPDVEQDWLNVIVKSDYIDPNGDFFEEFKNNLEQPVHNISDEDLNLLINA